MLDTVVATEPTDLQGDQQGRPNQEHANTNPLNGRVINTLPPPTTLSQVLTTPVSSSSSSSSPSLIPESSLPLLSSELLSLPGIPSSSKLAQVTVLEPRVSYATLHQQYAHGRMTSHPSIQYSPLTSLSVILLPSFPPANSTPNSSTLSQLPDTIAITQANMPATPTTPTSSSSSASLPLGRYNSDNPEVEQVHRVAGVINSNNIDNTNDTINNQQEGKTLNQPMISTTSMYNHN